MSDLRILSELSRVSLTNWHPEDVPCCLSGRNRLGALRLCCRHANVFLFLEKFRIVGDACFQIDGGGYF